MRPCVMLTEPSFPVFSMDFAEAWQKLGKEAARIRMNAGCSACRMREVCQTCAACALLETGSYDGVPEYMCRYTEETLRLLRKDVEKSQEAESDAI